MIVPIYLFICMHSMPLKSAPVSSPVCAQGLAVYPRATYPKLLHIKTNSLLFLWPWNHLSNCAPNACTCTRDSLRTGPEQVEEHWGLYSGHPQNGRRAFGFPVKQRGAPQKKTDPDVVCHKKVRKQNNRLIPHAGDSLWRHVIISIPKFSFPPVCALEWRFGR